MLPESRLRSLYSDFRDLKQLNPDGYDANIIQWKDYLIKEVWNDTIIVNGQNLLEYLSISPYGPPKSIDVVLDELVEEGTLIPLEKFNEKRQNLVLSVLRWTINKMIVDLSWKSRKDETSKYLKSVEYVNNTWLKLNKQRILYLLEENIRDVSTRSTDYVYTKKDFYKISKLSTITKDWGSYEVILTSLAQENHILMNDQNVIKIISPLSKHVSNNTVEITPEDVCAAEINEYVHTAEAEIESSEKSLKSMRERLLNSISSGSSMEIKRTLLRLKKRAEKRLDQSYTSLESLKKIQDEISSANRNVVMVNMLKQGNTALKAINSQFVDEDEINDLLDEFQENIDQQERIQELLVGQDEDDVSVEKELLEMEIEMSKEMVKNKSPSTAAESAKSETASKNNSTDELVNKLKSLNVSDSKLKLSSTDPDSIKSEKDGTEHKEQLLA